jgi:competence protein ComEC
MLLSLVALIAGILLGPCVDPAPVWICFPFSILLSCLRRGCVLLTIFLLGCGVASLQSTVPRDPGETAVRLIGTLRKAPEWHGLGIYLDVQLETVDGQAYRGRARLTEFLQDRDTRQLFDQLDLGSGDRVQIVVKLRRPSVYRNPGVFDFRHYLEREGVYWTGTIRSPRLITVLSRGWHGPDRIKNWIQARLEGAFRSDRNIQGLISGMVLGRKDGLTPEVERQFQAGGLYHLVVVSGFNLAVVSSVAMWLAGFLPCKRRSRLLFVLSCATGYALLVEGQAPVERAFLMVCFLILGKLLDRGYSALNTVGAAGFVILLIDPSSIQDSSFQMTFAAVAAVIGLGIPASQWTLGWLRDALKDFNDSSKDTYLPAEVVDWRIARRVWCELRGLPSCVLTIPWKILLVIGEAAVVSFGVEMVFLPFMVESFHRFSPISPFLNIPAGVAASVVTPLGLLVILLPPPLSNVAAWTITQILTALLHIVSWAVRLPGATIRVPSVPAWLWVSYIGTLLSLVLAIHKRWKTASVGTIGLIGALQAVIAFGDFSPRPPVDVTLTFLDVGQGDSILIEFPSGQRMLIDGGGVAAGRFLDLRNESTFSIGENVVSAYLFSRRIRKLDTVVLTHAHNDHMDGLFAVIENFQIGEFWLGRNPMTPKYRDLVERIQEKQIPVRWVSAGQKIGAFTVLHPPPNWKPRKNDQNNDSVVLLLDSGNGTALLTGDIEQQIPLPDKVDVLKVPHHGSKGVRFRVPSALRIISVGANNPFGHPHESALPALRTDRVGAITISFSRGTGHLKMLKMSTVKMSTVLTEPCLSCKLAFLFTATNQKDVQILRLSGF